MTGTVRRELSGRLPIPGEHRLRRVLAGNLLHDHTARPTAPLGQLPPGHPHARPPQTASLSTGPAASRPAGGLTHDYQLAA